MAARRRRRLQFSLRTLLGLTVLCALFFGWLATKINRARAERHAVTAIRAIGGNVLYLYEVQAANAAKQPIPPGPKWLRWILGDNFFAEVQSVYYPPGATDDDMEHLDGLRHLRRLKLSGSATTPAGRARLWKRRELASLELRSNSISDDEIVLLVTLTELSFLDLANTPITDRAVETLRRLQVLEGLNLSGTHISNEAAKPLDLALLDLALPYYGDASAWAPAPSEEQRRVAASIERAGAWQVRARCQEQRTETEYRVIFFHGSMHNGLIADLRRLDNFESLNLCDTPLTSLHWAQLTADLPLADASANPADDQPGRASGLAGLRTLFISYQPVNQEAMSYIKRFRNLRSLGLQDAQVTDVALAQIVEMTSLEELTLSGNQISDAGLAHLKRLDNLRELHLSDNRFTDAALLHLTGLTKLDVLWLHCGQITDARLGHLVNLTNLKELSLTGTRITDAGLAHLAKLRNLEALWLDSADVTDAGLVHLKELEHLRHVYLSGTAVTRAAKKDIEAHIAGFSSVEEWIWTEKGYEEDAEIFEELP